MMRKVSGLALILALGFLVGCGAGTKPVEGIVTMDGKPLEGATVMFNPQGSDGQPADGKTDASGKFTLSTRGKPGAAPGNYKVTVTQSKALFEGVDPSKMKPGTPEYAEAMKKAAAKMGSGAGGALKDKGGNELPAKYGEAKSTPFTVKVPPDSQPVKLDLTSK